MQIAKYVHLMRLFRACRRSRWWLAGQRKSSTDKRRTVVLNRLRNEINENYGYRKGVPRINLGPCGRFAYAFREKWNIRVSEKVSIAFVMTTDGSQCHHVVIRLPDGNYYDGGNGVMPQWTLLTLFPGSRIDEMPEFDLQLLDKRSYGLARSYATCPNYSDVTTARIIESHLAQLPKSAALRDEPMVL